MEGFRLANYSKSPDLSTIEYAFHLLKKKLKGETSRKQTTERSYSTSLEKHHTTRLHNRLIISVGHWFDAVSTRDMKPNIKSYLFEFI